MLRKRRKLFSIETGGPSSKRKTGKNFFMIGTGYAVGSAVGAGVLATVPALAVGCFGGPGLTLFAGTVTAAAIYGGMSRGLAYLAGWGFNKLNSLEEVIKVSERTDTSGHSFNRVGFQEGNSGGVRAHSICSVNRKLIVKNGNPSRYAMTFAIRNGSAVILLNKPSRRLLDKLNAALIEMYNMDTRSDYVSQKIEDGYVLNVKTSAEGFILLLNAAQSEGLKLNYINTEALLKNANM